MKTTQWRAMTCQNEKQKLVETGEFICIGWYLVAFCMKKFYVEFHVVIFRFFSLFLLLVPTSILCCCLTGKLLSHVCPWIVFSSLVSHFGQNNLPNVCNVMSLWYHMLLQHLQFFKFINKFATYIGFFFWSRFNILGYLMYTHDTMPIYASPVLFHIISNVKCIVK